MLTDKEKSIIMSLVEGELKDDISYYDLSGKDLDDRNDLIQTLQNIIAKLEKR